MSRPKMDKESIDKLLSDFRNNPNRIELRSEEFQEVLGSVPPWILRWGITFVACIVTFLLIGSAIFKYPEIISSSITLTSSSPVARIVAKTSGKLQQLYIQDNQEVAKDSYLAVIENSANTDNILQLKKYLRGIDDFSALALIPPAQMQLGSLQSSYAEFYSSLSEYKQFIDLGYHLKKINYMQERIAQNEKHRDNMLRQQALLAEQSEISKTQYQRDSLLVVRGALSQETLENSYTKYLQSRLSTENMYTTIENLHIQIEQLHEALYDTQYQYTDNKNTLETRLRSQISRLQAEIEAWEISYALISPISGRITFTEYWVENQNITAGNVVFNIVPTETGKLIGKASMPTTRSGKVAIGQRVNIRFINFPDNEYGIVRGFVSNMSLVPSKGTEVNQYIVEVELPDGLITSYKKELPFLPEMEGQADIVTADLSVLERFLLPLKKVLTEGLN